MRYATKKVAREVIEREMSGTYYAEGFLKMDVMKRHFLDSGFGQHETNVIIAALVLAGAKFDISED